MVKSFQKKQELSDLLFELLESIVEDIREARQKDPKESVYYAVKVYDDAIQLYQLLADNPKTEEIEERYFNALEGK